MCELGTKVASCKSASECEWVQRVIILASLNDSWNSQLLLFHFGEEESSSSGIALGLANKMCNSIKCTREWSPRGLSYSAGWMTSCICVDQVRTQCLLLHKGLDQHYCARRKLRVLGPLLFIPSFLTTDTHCLFVRPTCAVLLSSWFMALQLLGRRRGGWCRLHYSNCISKKAFPSLTSSLPRRRGRGRHRHATADDDCL